MSTKFNENLRRLRKKAGITQEELANIVGASTPAVGGWEKDLARPRLQRHVDALCEYFGVTEEELFNGEGDTANAAPYIAPHLAPVISASQTLNEAGIAKVAAYAVDLAGNPAYRS